ncbi:hypothetical protein KTD31_02830 [Burkholderia multivorans]|uniref:hypothetical protein n=1 Tax=Burkholderia multivorans TaxID=87883 RepID=UPI001C2374D3|nr:hypothetical protein [Burkholderia multivorans]MBU9200297.1 hypothetical protein [Burkholderia multivorans]MDN8078577.1 hypothetical protein [Burkholderia multivorans]
MFIIKKDGEELDRKATFAEAKTEAQVALLRERGAQAEPITLDSDEPGVTVSIWHDDKLVAALTNRLIRGNFVKQRWGGRKKDYAEHVSDEPFDATSYVLLLPLEELVELEDHDQNTDAIGTEFIRWNGPFEVEIVDSILSYFGVDDLEDITEEALVFAREWSNAQPAETETLTLTIKVKVNKAPGTSTTDFIENLDYSVESNTPGIVVVNTEIIDTDA